MKKAKGFTLIELMIVVAVVALLAAVAIPAYSKQIRKGRRADARQALGALVLKQEKWRTDHATYGTLADLGGSSATYYTVTLAAGSNTATGYTFNAAPIGDQAKDPCGTLGISMTSGNLSKSPTTEGCW